VVKKFGKREREERISGKVQAVANGTRPDARVAAYEYEETLRKSVNAEAALAPEVHWRDAYTGQVRKRRGVHMRHRNKAVLKLQWQKFQQRAALVTAEVAKAAQEAARKKKADGVGTAARAAQRAVDKVAVADEAVAKREASATMIHYDDAFVAAGAAKSDPPRMALGTLNLLKPPSKEVLALECECRGLVVKRSGSTTAKPNEPTELVVFLVQRLREHHDGDNVIPKMTTFEAGKRTKTWRGSLSGGGSSSLLPPLDEAGGGGGGGGSSGGGGGSSSLSAAPSPGRTRLPPLPGADAAISRAGRGAEEPTPLSPAFRLPSLG
jgi:uncharacterized membrane protein YgcG